MSSVSIIGAMAAALTLSGSLAFAQAVVTPPIKPLNTFGITPAGDCKVAVQRWS